MVFIVKGDTNTEFVAESIPETQIPWLTQVHRAREIVLLFNWSELANANASSLVLCHIKSYIFRYPLRNLKKLTETRSQ